MHIAQSSLIPGEGLLLRQLRQNGNSQGGRGNFTYLLEGQINFALKLSVGCLISQLLMLFCPIFLVGFDQHVFLQFYCKTIMWSKIVNFQIRSFEKLLVS